MAPALEASASRTAGSPALLGSMRAGIGWPVTARAASTISKGTSRKNERIIQTVMARLIDM